MMNWSKAEICEANRMYEGSIRIKNLKISELI